MLISLLQRTLPAPRAVRVLAAAQAGGSTAARARERRGKIQNETCAPSDRGFARRVDASTWGPSRLGSAQIPPPGATATINLDRDIFGCYFSFRAEFKDGRAMEARSVKFCGGATIACNDN